MGRGRSNSGSAMVLESRHLVGVFLVAVVLGGVFFTLGYVLGRSQQADAKIAGPRPVPGLKAADQPQRGSSPGAEPVISPADWDFYKKAGKTKPQLVPAPPVEEKRERSVPAPRPVAPAPTGAKNMVQVAALKNPDEARHLVARLKRKRYAAFVVPPGSDSYYRVQVGPFADAREAEAVRQKLAQEGFKAIVKH
ncbi:MAG TPA: SPOR domain-containing protein [Candidatus Acidoferrales bacterium]